MKIVHLSIEQLGADAKALCTQSDLSSFSFFQRSSVGEFLHFISTTVSQRTDPGMRQSIQQDAYTIHAYRPPMGNICCIVITDHEYPQRVAQGLATKLLQDFDTRQGEFESVMKEYLQKYQEPRQADNIMKVQQELDETKVVLHKTIEGLLERNEKLENLVDRSNQLSSQSKMFYKTAKNTNSCCVLM